MKKIIALFLIIFSISIAKADVATYEYNYTHGMISMGIAIISVLILRGYIRYRNNTAAGFPSYMKFLIILLIMSFLALIFVPVYNENYSGPARRGEDIVEDSTSVSDTL